jgi:hypothetical protein
LLKFLHDKKLSEAESLSSVVSADPIQPTVFDVVGSLSISEGEQLFDMLRWETKIADFQSLMTYRGQGTGTIKDECFAGTFIAEYESHFPALPSLCLTMSGTDYLRATP